MEAKPSLQSSASKQKSRDDRLSEEKWNELFARPEAKRVMREMAHKALEDYCAERTTGVAITKDGRLAPARNHRQLGNYRTLLQDHLAQRAILSQRTLWLCKSNNQV